MIEKKRKFGEELAQQRESKGVSLEQMAKATKIRKPVLEALEAGRFEELPPDVFTIGFLKLYAAQIDINPVQLVAQYKRLGRDDEPEEGQRPAARPRPEISSTAVVVGCLVALVLLGVAACLLYRFQAGAWPLVGPTRTPVNPHTRHAQKKTPATPPAPSEELQRAAPAETQSPASMPAVQEPKPQGESAQVLQPPQAQTAVSAPIRPSGDLVLACSQPCWLEVWAGTKKVLGRQVSPGESLAFQGERFRLNIGNAAGLTLAWKGHPVALPPAKGRVLKNFVLPPAAEGGPGP